MLFTIFVVFFLFMKFVIKTSGANSKKTAQNYEIVVVVFTNFVVVLINFLGPNCQSHTVTVDTR